MSRPDPKPARRIVDPSASRRKLAADPRCRACGEAATNCHHLIGRAQSGDDVAGCLIPLCGSGAHGCHGALHGNTYVRAGHRWEARDVRETIGLNLRWPELAYVLQKLGVVPGLEHLRTRYLVEVDSLTPLRFRPFTRA